MADIIDKTSEIYGRAFEKARERIEKFGMAAIGKLSQDELFRLVSAPSFTKEIIAGAGIKEIIDSYEGEFLTLARRIAGPDITPQAIRALQSDAVTSIYEYARDVASELQSVLKDSAIAKVKPNVLKQQILNATTKLSKSQVGSLMNTSLRNFSRATQAEMDRNLVPDTAEYRYEGPSDDRNRPFCAEWVGRVITKAELQTLTNDDGQSAMIWGGGWNCRHTWQLVVE